MSAVGAVGSAVRQLLAARSFWITAVFAVLVLSLTRLESPAPPGACVAGDVRAVLSARVPAEMRAVQFDAAGIDSGMGIAAVDGLDGLGDAVVVAGHAFVSSTRQTLRGQPLIEHERFFQASSLLYVPPGSRAHDSWQVRTGTSLAELWHALALRYPNGVLVAGMVQWKILQRYAMTRSPVDGLSFFEHSTHYYTRPMEILPDARTYLVGIVAHARIMPSGNKLYARLFARHPDGEIDLPARVLVLKSRPHDPWRAPTVEEAVSVGRSASGSILAGGTLRLYPLQTLQLCDEAIVPLAGRAAD